MGSIFQGENLLPHAQILSFNNRSLSGRCHLQGSKQVVMKVIPLCEMSKQKSWMSLHLPESQNFQMFFISSDFSSSAVDRTSDKKRFWLQFSIKNMIWYPHKADFQAFLLYFRIYKNCIRIFTRTSP